MSPHTRPPVLTIAGSDSCGGAGVQADLKTITCLGGYGMSAITALTAQNTQGVFGVHPVPPAFVEQQITLCLEDIGAAAAKTGMLCNAEIVSTVARVLARYPGLKLVADSVLVSKSGHRLLAPEAEDAFRRLILPIAWVVTPNIPEAEALTGLAIHDRPSLEQAAFALARLGARRVLLKAGHLSTPGCVDLYYDGARFHELPGPRLDARHTHGTGCSLSAAIATGLALGLGELDALRMAKRFITEAIRHGLPLGHGCGPTDPLAGAQAADLLPPAP